MGGDDLRPKRRPTDYDICNACGEVVGADDCIEIFGQRLHIDCLDRLDGSRSSSSAPPPLPKDGPNRRDGEADSPLPRLRDGDHMAFVYGDDYQHGEMLCSLVTGAIQSDHLLVLIASEERCGKYEEYLSRAGMEMSALLESGQVALVFDNEMREKPALEIFRSSFGLVRKIRSKGHRSANSGLTIVNTTLAYLIQSGRFEEVALLEEYWRDTILELCDAGVRIAVSCPYLQIPIALRGRLQRSHTKPLLIPNGVRRSL